MLITFYTQEPRASISMGHQNSVFPTAENLSLILCATETDQIVFPDGSDLSKHEISITFYPGKKLAVPTDCIGFLSHKEGGDPFKEPFIYGAVDWDNRPIPYHLFQKEIGVTLSLELSNVPNDSEWEDPFLWKPDTKLIIKSLGIESSFRTIG